MGGFLAGLMGGLSAGTSARKEGGSIIDRFKRTFGSKKETSSVGVPETGATEKVAEATRPSTDFLSAARVVRSQDDSEVQKPNFDKGGMVRKTATYRLKKGEFIVPAAIVSRLKKRATVRKPARKTSRR